MELDVYKEWLGIPEGERPPDHYTLLRLKQFEDDAAKIRNNYRKLNGHVRKYATGRYSVESQELLNELAKAMLLLTDAERKREYDDSMGREFEDVGDPGDARQLSGWLREQGVAGGKVREAETFAEERGLTLRDAVVQMKLVDEETAAMGQAVELGFSYVDLAETVPDDNVLDQVQRNMVKRNTFVPLFVDEDYLLVACVEEPPHELEDELRMIYARPIRPVVASLSAINAAITKYYAPGERNKLKEEVVAEAPSDKKKKKEKPEKKKVEKKKSTAGKRMSQLSPEEQQERKQIGILIICWALIGPIMFDEFIMKPYVLPGFLNIAYVPSVTTFLVSPATIFYVLKTYWK
ncbi:MAG: general secretion pathway protein GspE [Planctomycetaceae bacterium]|nr:general secretion pathway protein GspE [Planctomycetaceae bacterium]